jgi:hypothetical protein
MPLQLTAVPLGAAHNLSLRAAGDHACASGWDRGVVHVTWFEPDVGPGAVGFTTAPAGAVPSAFASFGFATTAAPGTTDFQYSLDGSSWCLCGPSLRVGPLAPGPHSLAIRASDGVTVSANATAMWTVQSQSSYQLQVRGGCCGACLSALLWAHDGSRVWAVWPVNASAGEALVTNAQTGLTSDHHVSTTCRLQLALSPSHVLLCTVALPSLYQCATLPAGPCGWRVQLDGAGH